MPDGAAPAPAAATADVVSEPERASGRRRSAVDVTLPGRHPGLGRLHPVTLVERETIEIFTALGYSVADGPEVETPFHNFAALNVAEGHPAREGQGTFLLEDGLLLRTHTMPVAIRAMLSRRPPIRVICPGRVFRRDLRQAPMLHQIAGLAVAEGLTFGHLKGTLEAFAKRLFWPEVGLRLRPGSFPSTEPSAEVDVTCPLCRGEGCDTCSGSGWIEVLGAGMVDPRVLAACEMDPEIYAGFAFGLWSERVAMIRYGFRHPAALRQRQALATAGARRMPFSLDWLSRYADLPVAVEELARRLGMAGLSVAGTRDAGTDLLLDVEVPANRPDCLSHVGLAREIAVLCDEPLKKLETIVPEVLDPAREAAAVEVEDEEACLRYVARVVRGIRVAPSPEWLRRRLEDIGIPSVNNIVDVVSFVYRELGQPLHVFDLARLAGRRVVVRRAREGERLTTLDGVERELTEDMMVVADAERPRALAGIVGGADSGVTAESTEVLIESAHFARKAVRRTARRLGLSTEAAHRFERGSDPEACLEAANRAAILVAEVTGGEILSGAIDVRAEMPKWPPRGFLDLARLNAFTGMEIPRNEVNRRLTGLGFRLRTLDDDIWEVTVPSWRYFDFEPREDGKVHPADLYEEVLRHYGYDKVPPALPALSGADPQKSRGPLLRRRVRDHLVACGYSEAINHAFGSPAADAAFPCLAPGSEPLALANPLSERSSVLRRSLVPGLVESARFDQRRGSFGVRLFEIGRVFFPPPPDVEPERDDAPPLPLQPETVAVVCGGRSGTPWDGQVELDLFDLKGAVESLAATFGVALVARPARLRGLAAGAAAELYGPASDAPVGFLGRVEQDEAYPLYAGELALAALLSVDASLPGELPPRLHGVPAALTLTHPLSVPWAEIDRAIRELGPPELVSFRLEDRYRGRGVPDGAVNVTISCLYAARDRSLSRDEVNVRQEALAAELERRFGFKG